jgi:hypothetical protein
MWRRGDGFCDYFADLADVRIAVGALLQDSAVTESHAVGKVDEEITTGPLRGGKYLDHCRARPRPDHIGKCCAMLSNDDVCQQEQSKLARERELFGHNAEAADILLSEQAMERLIVGYRAAPLTRALYLRLLGIVKRKAGPSVYQEDPGNTARPLLSQRISERIVPIESRTSRAFTNCRLS